MIVKIHARSDNNQAHKQGDRQVLQQIRRKRRARGPCRIDHHNVALANPDDADFPVALQQTGIEFAVGIHFALQDIILHTILTLGHELIAQFGDARCQPLFQSQRLAVICLQACN